VGLCLAPLRQAPRRALELIGMIARLFPRQFDNRFEGSRVALWILGLLLLLRLVMSVNSIFNTESVAAGADKFPLASYGADGARAVLMLFSLQALAGLMPALFGVLALVRYRAMVPLLFLLLTAEHVARRLIVQSYAIARSEPTTAAYVINYGMIALLAGGLILSLLPARQRRSEEI
jgi:hypothetical protein